MNNFEPQTTLESTIGNAEKNLPEGYVISINIRFGSTMIHLVGADGISIPLPMKVAPMKNAIGKALEVAIDDNGGE